MHEAYVIGLRARNSRYILLKEIKKTCSSSIVEFYKHLRIFKNTRGVRGVLLGASLVFLKIPACL